MPVGATLATAGATLAGSVFGTNAASKASDKALQASLAQQNKVWDAVNPYMTAGQSALGRISNPNELMKAFTTSPGYQFRLDRGLDAVTTNRAVNGLLKSGSAVKAVNDYAAGQASSEFGNWWNQQAGLANMGLQGAQTGAGVANSAQQAIMTNGANQGNASMVQGNAFGQFGGTLADILQRYGNTGGNNSSYQQAPLDDPSIAGLI